MKPFVCVVTGGRKNFNQQVVNDALGLLVGLRVHLFMGDATGVDSTAYLFGKRMRAEHIPKHERWVVEYHVAEWDRYGYGAGPKRNEKMVYAAIQRSKSLDCNISCFAFQGGTGTAQCTSICKQNNVKIYHVPQ